MSFLDLFLSLTPVIAVAGAWILLFILFIIDLRVLLLPNIYVFPFGLLGVVFHISTGFTLISTEQMILGGIAGAGLLYLVRYLGTLHYKQEAMGLGDIKLMGAGGLWLGVDDIIMAIMIGAMAGLIHGVLLATFKSISTRAPFSIHRLVLPAGPGFIIGIISIFVMSNGVFVLNLFADLWS